MSLESALTGLVENLPKSVGIRCPNCGGKNIEPEIEKIYYQEFSHKCLDCEYKFCVSGDDINVKNSKLFP